jgi:AAA family ATP:ADP antiporter
LPRRTIERLFGIRPDEVGPALLCALCYFLVLSAWFIIRPVREQLGLAGGVENLNWLFLATLGVTLAATPIYGALAHRLSRGAFIATVYAIFIGTLLLFGAAFSFLDGQFEVWIGRAFYIWVSVLNMFLIAVFTALMVDIWSFERSRRAFGLIAVGGTLGAISGSAITSALAAVLPITGLLTISCSIFISAAAMMILVQRRFAKQRAATEARDPLTFAKAAEGFTLVARSPYLLGVCAFMLCLTILNSFLYFEQARIVAANVETREARTAIFAQINLWTQSLTLAAQIFLTAHALRRLGTALTLLMLPLVTLGGFAALAMSPTLAVLIAFQVIRGASNYGFAKPARETLFTVVTRNEKYKAKGFIDTFVYRGGDAIGALSDKAVAGWISIGAIPYLAMGIAGCWGVVAILLGLQQRRIAARSEPEVADLGATPPAGVSPAALRR